MKVTLTASQCKWDARVYAYMRATLTCTSTEASRMKISKISTSTCGAKRPRNIGKRKAPH